MILRLCRLDDDDRSQRSFREALKAIRAQIPDKEAKAIDKSLKRYRALINPLKTKARNYYIAHLDKEAKETLYPQYDLIRVISQAVEIFDEIAGERIDYTFRPTKDAPIIRLREYLKKPGLKPWWDRENSTTAAPA